MIRVQITKPLVLVETGLLDSAVLEGSAKAAFFFNKAFLQAKKPKPIKRIKRLTTQRIKVEDERTLQITLKAPKAIW